MELLISAVHLINTRADTKVTSEFVAELKRVSGKENILFKMTEAALESPEERVEDVIYPVVPGGYPTLLSLLHEYKSKGTSYRQHRQRVFKASYTNHYRTGLIQILEVLEFGSTNTVHAPMMETLAPIKRCKEIWVAGVIEEEHSVKLFPGRRARINPVGGLFICQELHRHVPKDTPDLPGIS